jgi:hypothetical protein
VKWRPNTRTGLWAGIGIMAGIMLIDVGLVWRVVGGPINGWTFASALLALLSVPVIAVLGYWLYDFSRLGYEFDRNRLVIRTAGTQQTIPTGSIERVIDGREAQPEARMQSLTWPGYCVGQGQVEGVGLTLFYAAGPPRSQAIVVTPSLAYGISVDDMESLIEVLDTAQELGPSAEVEQRSSQAPYVGWDIWHDRLAQGALLAGIALNLALFGLLLLRYPALPDAIPMHWDATGAVDRIALREEAFALPVFGLITLLANDGLGAVFYRRQRVASYMLWSGAVLVELLFFLALWQIIV